MKKILNYIFPDGQLVKLGEEGAYSLFYTWMHTQVELFPDTIFFYTVETTDIFED